MKGRRRLSALVALSFAVLLTLAIPRAGQVFDANTEIRASSSRLDVNEPGEQWFVEVPPGASTLRVALNADLTDTNHDQAQNDRDFDLYVRRGAPPSLNPPAFDCPPPASIIGVPFEYCEIPNPAAGDLVDACEEGLRVRWTIS